MRHKFYFRMKYILLCKVCYTGWFLIPWHISQNRYTWMADKTSTCDPNIRKETLHVYLYLPRALSFVGCRQGSSLTENGGDESKSATAEDQALLHWPPGSPDLKLSDFFFLWFHVKGSFYRLYRLSCEDGSSLLSRKSLLTCRGYYGPKWIISFSSAVPQMADAWNTCEVRQKMENFSFYVQLAFYNPFCPSRAPILWNVLGNYESPCIKVIHISAHKVAYLINPNHASCAVCISPLTPNEPYRRRTAPLTSKVAFYIFIQQI